MRTLPTLPRTVILALFLGIACRDPGPPPHPPPHAKLDIVVDEHTLRINGSALDVRSTSLNQFEAAIGQPASNADEYGADWKSLGFSAAWEPRGEAYRIIKITILFEPYGTALDKGMKPFPGRLIVNGAWIHPDAYIYHLEKELGEPCTHGNQGWGRFAEEPFRDSWGCDVAGQPFGYWMKYRASRKNRPLVAFDAEFLTTSNPTEPPPPTMEENWEYLKGKLRQLFN